MTAIFANPVFWLGIMTGLIIFAFIAFVVDLVIRRRQWR